MQAYTSRPSKRSSWNLLCRDITYYTFLLWCSNSTCSGRESTIAFEYGWCPIIDSLLYSLNFYISHSFILFFLSSIALPCLFFMTLICLISTVTFCCSISTSFNYYSIPFLFFSIFDTRGEGPVLTVLIDTCSCCSVDINITIYISNIYRALTFLF